MKGAITAALFIEQWRHFMDTIEDTPDWSTAWMTSSEWSRRVLGTKSSLSIGSPVGDFFTKQFPGLRYRSEDGLFDLCMTLQGNLNAIPTLDRNYHPDSFEPEQDSFYPSFYDVLLEHENDIYSSWQEVAKLSYVRGRLKVLVTYTRDHGDATRTAEEIHMMEETVRSILFQTTVLFKDEGDTEFLLLVGTLRSGSITWSARTFDHVGELKESAVW